MRSCRSSRPRRSSRRSAGSSPPSASSRASRSTPMRACARSSPTPSPSATPRRAPLSLRAARIGGLRLLRADFDVAQSAVRRRLRFHAPPPEITKEGVKPFPYTGARTLDARTAFFYAATGVTPAMIMRLPDVGSQYLFGILDAERRALRRRQDLQGDAAAEHPGGEVLVVHALRQPDSLDAADRRSATRAPAARATRARPPKPNADGSTTVYFGPTQAGRRARTATGSRPCPARAGS